RREPGGGERRRPPRRGVEGDQPQAACGGAPPRRPGEHRRVPSHQGRLDPDRQRRPDGPAVPLPAPGPHRRPATRGPGSTARPERPPLTPPDPGGHAMSPPATPGTRPPARPTTTRYGRK